MNSEPGIFYLFTSKKIPRIIILSSGNAFAMSTLSDEVERALAAQQDDGSIEINIPAFVGDKNGMYDFNVTVEHEELKKFDL